jgi:hypothetical protein
VPACCVYIGGGRLAGRRAHKQGDDKSAHDRSPGRTPLKVSRPSDNDREPRFLNSGVTHDLSRGVRGFGDLAQFCLTWRRELLTEARPAPFVVLKWKRRASVVVLEDVRLRAADANPFGASPLDSGESREVLDDGRGCRRDGVGGE